MISSGFTCPSCGTLLEDMGPRIADDGSVVASRRLCPGCGLRDEVRVR